LISLDKPICFLLHHPILKILHLIEKLRILWEIALLGFDLALSALARFWGENLTNSLFRRPRWGNHNPKWGSAVRHLLQSGGVTGSTRRWIPQIFLQTVVGPTLTHLLRGVFQGQGNGNQLWTNPIQGNMPLGTREVHTTGIFNTKICH